MALSLLWRQVELGGLVLGGSRHEDLVELVQNRVHLGVELHNLVTFCCLLQRHSLILLHDLSEESAIYGVDDVEHELAVALGLWVVREVLLQFLVLKDHFRELLLPCVPVMGYVHRIDLEAVKDLLGPLEHLHHELGGAHALDGQVELP